MLAMKRWGQGREVGGEDNRRRLKEPQCYPSFDTFSKYKPLYEDDCIVTVSLLERQREGFPSCPTIQSIIVFYSLKRGDY